MARHQRSTRSARSAAVAAVVLGVDAAAWLAVWPCFYTGTAASSSGSCIQPCRVCSTLIGENGPWMIWLLLIPVALSAIALLASWTGKRVGVWVCAGVQPSPSASSAPCQSASSTCHRRSPSS
jgi:cytochrome bd-type quinol oxidase subunit 2